MRSVALLLLVLTAGCSIIGPYGRAPQSSNTREPPATEAEEIPPDPARRSESEAIDQAAALDKILVLLSGDAEPYTAVGDALGRTLAGRYEFHLATLTSDGEADGRLEADSTAWDAAIAIGADAAVLAGRRLRVPTVFCQTLEYEPLLDRFETLFGVDALPPLELQLRSWKQIAADVASVGIIVAEDDAELIESARAAANRLNIELRPAVAATDQDALYKFKRLAQTVDGIWLYPNGDILSPRAIREILKYASTHDVHSIVFSEALLGWGALLSVGADPDDVAATVTSVLVRLLEGDTDQLERMTPLSKVDTQLNYEVVAQLGISAGT